MPPEALPPTDARDANRQALCDALEALLATNGEFVLCEILGTDTFVQFANAGGRLLLDLPIVSLTGDQMDRAEAYFWRLGSVLRPGRDEIEGGNKSYQMDLGTDTARAARLALEIFQEVHGASDLSSLAIRIE
jgi:hypothetical protein